MGTDASIFALRRRECYHFDRHYNFIAHPNSEPAASICARLAYDGMVRGTDIITLAKANMKHWRTKGADDAHRILWNEAIIAFVEKDQEHEQDLFFVRTDTAYPNLHDLIRSGFRDVPDAELIQPAVTCANCACFNRHPECEGTKFRPCACREGHQPSDAF